MNMEISPEGVPFTDMLTEAEALYRETAEDLIQVIRRVRRGDLDEAKAAVQAVRDLKLALQLVTEERARVEKLGKQVAGAVGGAGLDIDAARAEIGRRLACLREAGGG